MVTATSSAVAGTRIILSICSAVAIFLRLYKHIPVVLSSIIDGSREIFFFSFAFICLGCLCYKFIFNKSHVILKICKLTFFGSKDFKENFKSNW